MGDSADCQTKNHPDVVLGWLEIEAEIAYCNEVCRFLRNRKRLCTSHKA